MAIEEAHKFIELGHVDGGLQAVIKSDPPAPESLSSILTGLRNLRRLSLMQPVTTLKNLDFLRQVPTLESLHINCLPTNADCSALLSANALQEITTGDRSFFDCAILPLIPSLKVFRSGPGVTSLHALCSCKSLEWLELRGVKNGDCSFLSGLSDLRRIRLWDCKIPCTDGMEDCVGLMSVDLGMSTFADLRCLPSLRKLTDLRIERCARVTDSEAISKCYALRVLDVSRCKFELGGHFFQFLQELEVFAAVGVKIADSALTSLSLLPYLKKISLSKRMTRHFAGRADLRVFGY